ncbi:cell wall hydrolase [Telmatospirillum sp. J64-1]|uniref:cell wall hydrolase n=1 Tax=Telmatospirillum sp. J64-1 TaxID=2502183 RepID=UPI00115E8E4F|nr:cell wall hydrolase [Telmatospirillum sp. J64-1]
MSQLSPSATDIDILARTLYGEARGEGIAGMSAVAHVILNRVRRRRWYGAGVPGYPDHSIAAVCLKAWQFSCWNAADPNRPKLIAADLSDPALRRAMLVACAVVNDEPGFTDATQGADHYHTRSVSPDWAQGRKPVVSIGGHLFYNDIP